MHTHLTLEKRRRLESLYDLGLSQTEIARRLRVNRSTISRELKRNGVNGRYDARFAHKLAMQMKKRPKGISRPACRLSKVVLNRISTGDWVGEFKNRLIKTGHRNVRIPHQPRFYYQWRRCAYRKPLSKDQKRMRRWHLKRRVRDHILENNSRWREWWRVFRLYRGLPLKDYVYPKRKKSFNLSGFKKSLWISGKFKRRPKFPGGYAPRITKKVLKENVVIDHLLSKNTRLENPPSVTTPPTAPLLCKDGNFKTSSLSRFRITTPPTAPLLYKDGDFKASVLFRNRIVYTILRQILSKQKKVLLLVQKIEVFIPKRAYGSYFFVRNFCDFFTSENFMKKFRGYFFAKKFL
jgi:transcriptional regulator with XRE-family HTH domain